MKKIIRLTERDLTRIVRRVINEQQPSSNKTFNPDTELPKYGFTKTSGGSYDKTIKNEKGQEIQREIIEPIGRDGVYIYQLYTWGKPELKFPGDLGIEMRKNSTGWTSYNSVSIPVNRIPDILKISSTK